MKFFLQFLSVIGAVALAIYSPLAMASLAFPLAAAGYLLAAEGRKLRDSGESLYFRALAVAQNEITLNARTDRDDIRRERDEAKKAREEELARSKTVLANLIPGEKVN